jgi:hypothetical protein
LQEIRLYKIKEKGSFTKSIETCGPLILGNMWTLNIGVPDLRFYSGAVERDANTSWTRVLDFIERFLLGWLWVAWDAINFIQFP